MTKTQEFRDSFKRVYQNLSDINSVQSEIVCYHGHKSDPRWVDTEPGATAVVVRAQEGTKRATRLDLVCRHGGKR